MIVLIFTNIILSKCNVKKEKKKKRHEKRQNEQRHYIVKINKHNIVIVFFFLLQAQEFMPNISKKILDSIPFHLKYIFFSHHLRKYNYLSPDMLRCYDQHACKGHKTSFSFLILFHLSCDLFQATFCL